MYLDQKNIDLFVGTKDFIQIFDILNSSLQKTIQIENSIGIIMD